VSSLHRILWKCSHLRVELRVVSAWSWHKLLLCANARSIFKLKSELLWFTFDGSRRNVVGLHRWRAVLAVSQWASLSRPESPFWLSCLEPHIFRVVGVGWRELLSFASYSFLVISPGSSDSPSGLCKLDWRYVDHVSSWSWHVVRPRNIFLQHEFLTYDSSALWLSDQTFVSIGSWSRTFHVCFGCLWSLHSFSVETIFWR